MEKVKEFYVYAHIIEETEEIFYIGKGKDNRAWRISGRNQYWNNITNKYKFKVDILYTSTSEFDAYKKEIELIEIYKPKANLSTGGEGGFNGISPSEKTRKLISEKLKGHFQSQEIIEKRKKTRALNNDNKPSPLKGKKLTEEHRRKISENQKGQHRPTKCKQVICLETGQIFRNLIEAAKWCNGHQHSISGVCRKKYGFKSHKGYTWEFFNESKLSSL